MDESWTLRCRRKRSGNEVFCQEFAEFLGGGYADGVNSGTTAVHVALKALKPAPFSEVVVWCGN
ncbi:MAG: DegT/DnrJ/EryC1/StrS family aminotransferase [Victivallaceae bacterium]|nr:DegT/DnrJ/EryC1/StrS family aminotransferase [Victivallaceae bacterium]